MRARAAAAEVLAAAGRALLAEIERALGQSDILPEFDRLLAAVGDPPRPRAPRRRQRNDPR